MIFLKKLASHQALIAHRTIYNKNKYFSFYLPSATLSATTQHIKYRCVTGIKPIKLRQINIKIKLYIKRPAAVSLCAVPPLGWGEFELCAMRNVKCCVLNVSNYF